MYIINNITSCVYKSNVPTVKVDRNTHKTPKNLSTLVCILQNKLILIQMHYFINYNNKKNYF